MKQVELFRGSIFWGKRMKAALLGLIQISLASQVWASGPDLKFGQPSYAGTGCVAGTASVPVSSDESQIGEIQFDQFKLVAKKGQVVRQACSIAIPMEIPDGYQVAVGPISEVKGYQNLSSSKAILQLNQEVFLSGARGDVKSSLLKGPINQNFVISNDLVLKDLRWSACGGSAILRVNLTALLTNKSKKSAIINIDSVNLLKSGHLYWRHCP